MVYTELHPHHPLITLTIPRGHKFHSPGAKISHFLFAPSHSLPPSNNNNNNNKNKIKSLACKHKQTKKAKRAWQFIKKINNFSAISLDCLFNNNKKEENIRTPTSGKRRLKEGHSQPSQSDTERTKRIALAHPRTAVVILYSPLFALLRPTVKIS